MAGKIGFSFALTPYILALCVSTASLGKGLDTLQADDEKNPAPAAPPAPTGTVPGGQPTPTSDSVPGGNALQPAVQTQAPTPVLIETEKMYLASSFSWINLKGEKGDWATGATGDIEVGLRVATILQKFDLFGTFRYRPVEAVIAQNQREYRGIVETYLFGAKGRLGLNNKLSVNASAELGASQTHINSNDSIVSIDESLEKSGVDLNLGGGVSYLVLDKFAVGAKLALGTGAYKSVQLGLDLRFML